MTTIGQLQLGIAQVVDRRTQERIGYVFSVANGGGQLQRWLLFRDPQNSFEVHPPPSSMTGWSLSDWQAGIPSLWKPGAFYVWAQSDVYWHGSTYGGENWTRIPSESKIPPPSYPECAIQPPDFQTWPGVESSVLCVLQEQRIGYIYNQGGLHDNESIEYWLLPAQYEPAGRGLPVGIAAGTEKARSLQEFVDLSNRSWGPGCAFVITACLNYRGKQPPAMP